MASGTQTVGNSAAMPRIARISANSRSIEATDGAKVASMPIRPPRANAASNIASFVYIAVQLPLTVYILESFFALIPSDLFDAARIDGYSEWQIFWKVSLPIALPALATTVILNTILLWNEFLYAVVLITDEAKRTLPLGIQRFMGDQLEDVGMIATGLMIAIVPVALVYMFFFEKLIQGMTAGAVK